MSQRYTGAPASGVECAPTGSKKSVRVVPPWQRPPREADEAGENRQPPLGDGETADLDRGVGRAVFDPAFRARLLANPAAALMAEAMPLPLKRALARLRAESLSAFALRALDAEQALSVE